MRPALVPAELRARPFTTAQARAAGLTHSALRGPEWRQVLRGVWAHVSVEDTREFRFAAVRLILPPRAVVCGLTAAWLYGADVRRTDDLNVHVSFPKSGRVRPRSGVVVSQETLEPADIRVADGIRITTPVRTVFDCLRFLRGEDGVVVADALTHLKCTTVDAVRTYFASHRGLRNLRIGGVLVDMIEPKSESPMETRLRLRLVAVGLPRPEAQWVVRNAAGRFVARLDLAYPEQRVAVEYDGAWHWQQRRRDDRRRDAARKLGWTVIVVSADDLFGAPGQVFADVRHALATSSSATKPAA
jgi:very-short-patch-repair endonuclease